MSQLPTMNADSLATATSERMFEYRAICGSAVIALVLGVLSLSALLLPILLFLPLAGIAVGTSAVLKIKHRSLELTGKPLALTGMILSLLFFVGGSTLHVYVYLTEVPEGYQRISFSDLQPEVDTLLPVPKAALQMDGQRIFIKGYVYPGDQRRRLQQFILVPDMGTCCFGGQPKLTDMVEVTLEGTATIDFNRRKRKLGGVLHVDTRLKPVSGLQGVYYRLDADHLE